MLPTTKQEITILFKRSLQQPPKPYNALRHCLRLSQNPLACAPGTPSVS
jgi:hypothetical protein